MTGATSTKPNLPITPQQGTESPRRTTSGQGHASPEEQTGQQRVEPSLGEISSHLSANAIDNQLHGDSSSYEEFAQYPSPARGRVSRILLMGGIFIIGATVGLSTAWWFNLPVSGTAVNSVEPVRRITAPTSPSGNAQIGQRSSMRGISPSELPYDGAAPPPIPVEKKTAKVVAATIAKPFDAPASSGAGVASRIESTDTTLTSKRLVPESVNQIESTPVVNTTEPKPPVKPKASAKAETPSAEVQKRHVPVKTVKDREIERIRQQVEDELKKRLNMAEG